MTGRLQGALHLTDIALKRTVIYDNVTTQQKHIGVGSISSMLKNCIFTYDFTDRFINVGGVGGGRHVLII